MARYARVNRDLPNRVAEHLTGLANIRVLWREPPYEGALGCVIKDGQQCLVYVDPAVESSSRWFVLLHELAHAKLHFSKIPDQSQHAQSAPGSIKRESVTQLGDHIHKPVEEEADLLAHRWQEWADWHAMAYWLEADSAPYDARLLALLEYPTT